jgi:hypothetical protein
MSGWRIEYLSVTGGSPLLTPEKDTLEIAVSLSIDRGWERNVARVVAIHGPDGRSISGDALEALRAEARRRGT